jgi:GH15 family glucan-1,4-alpha-glucosidase
LSLPIEDYAVVGDLRTLALVGRDGSIDWLCLPDLDSSACFAALLDTPSAGRWLLAPAGAGRATRRAYRGDSLVLETVWETESGSVRVVDFMPPRSGQPDLVRVVEGISGSVDVVGEIVVQFDYGSIVPWVRKVDGRWSAAAGPDSLWLDTPAPLVGEDERTVCRFRVAAGDRVPFVLGWAPSHEPAAPPVDAERALAETLEFWRQWMSRCTYRGRHAEAVRRSLLTLKALTYAPTGGVAAAATTSLPELIGGKRNWDYRFCWLRDAAFTLGALVGGGYVDEAQAWRDWLLRAAAGRGADLQIMYSLRGARRLPEYELPWLAGYEGSRPVRVGNAAVEQFQLDVWGEVLDGLHRARDAGLSRDFDAWALQRELAEFLETVWERPDRSLWEVRGPEQHFVHSKVMAWVGFDRMIRTAERASLPAPLDRWRAARAAVHAQVCERGYDAERQTFTQFYGSQGVDAALLLIPRLGFLPPDDPRVLGTIRAVQRELAVGDGLILRYSTTADPTGASETVDGLPGEESPFVICNFWLADALALAGRREQAAELFERLLELRNDVGLLSEQWDPVARRHVGNTPQAFSHVGLVNTAYTLDHASQNADSAVPASARLGRPDGQRGGATAAAEAES